MSHETRQQGAQALKRLLAERGLSYRDFAAEAGIGFSTVGAYTRGELDSPKVIRKMADALGLHAGIELLKAYGINYMITDFEEEHRHRRVNDALVDRVIERLRPELGSIVREELRSALVSLGDAKPGSHAPLAPVTVISDWVRRPMPAEAAGF